MYYKIVLVSLFLVSSIGQSMAQKSLDEIDRDSFKASGSPFEKEGIELKSGLQQFKPVASPADIDLNGEWQLAEGGSEKERLKTDWNDALPAQVPGSVHTALWKAGMIPDPYFGQNDSIAEKQSYKTWWYKKEFVVDESLNAPVLDFGGIANKCTVWLNGVRLGDHEGMFGGPTFDVSKLIKERNTLIVCLHPIPQVFEPEGTFFGGANKSWQNTVVFNCVYGWHYSQIPSLGIWRDVKIKNQSSVVIENPFVGTRTTEGDMSLQVTLKRTNAKIAGTLQVAVMPENFTGKEQTFYYDVKSSKQSEALNFDFKIDNPRLWWPNDKGEQNLYRLKISFVPEKGTPDFCETTFGVRTIEMAPFPDGPAADKYNWTFVVNGKPMFVKGTGWCTMDPLMDFSRERYDRFLSLARRQHVQMLRAWGGGMPETDDFYDLCDRYGIMVIQEWPTAWDSHNTQPYHMLEETVRLNTLRIRNHPSLVMYGGGNESANPFGKAIDMMGRYSIELDGTRPFHRGEAWGGSDHNYNCWWDEAHLNHNLNMTSAFWGEFGIASFPQKESVFRYIPDSEKAMWPFEFGTDLVHHNPIFGKVGEMGKLKQYAGYFMPYDNIDNFILGSQLAQVVAVRHTLERSRTRWPETTGALYYKMNDNYPAVSWSCADWYGAAKPLHYFVQNSFSPVASVILFDRTNLTGQNQSLPIFLLDDNLQLQGKDWEVNITCYDDHFNEIEKKTFEAAENHQTVHPLGSFDLKAEQVKTRLLLFVSEVKADGELLFRTFYFMNFEVRKGTLFNLPRTTLSLTRHGESVEIRNTGNVPAVGVNVQCPGHEDKLTVSENFFWLNPGETKNVQVNVKEAIKVDCWNLEGNEYIK